LNDPAPQLDLATFLPYRLAVLSNTVSAGLSRTYASRFGLSIPEWRVMAILGRETGLSILELVERSAMDKVAVSRAAARLRTRLLVADAVGPDRRRRALSLTEAGRALYAEIVPLARAHEAALLSALSPVESAALETAMARLLDRARELLP
jgi:DNA-binding MarR family transcriptional regulator